MNVFLISIFSDGSETSGTALVTRLCLIKHVSTEGLMSITCE